MVCPTSIAAATSNNKGTATVSFGLAVWDNDKSAELSVQCTPNEQSPFNVGVTAVMCVARDASNNTAACSFAVNVTGTFSH